MLEDRKKQLEEAKLKAQLLKLKHEVQSIKRENRFWFLSRTFQLLITGVVGGVLMYQYYTSYAPIREAELRFAEIRNLELREKNRKDSIYLSQKLSEIKEESDSLLYVSNNLKFQYAKLENERIKLMAELKIRAADLNKEKKKNEILNTIFKRFRTIKDSSYIKASKPNNTKIDTIKSNSAEANTILNSSTRIFKQDTEHLSVKRGNHLFELGAGNYLIAGVYSNFQNAEDASDKYFNKGFNNAIVGFISSLGSYVVALESSNSLDQLMKKAEKLPIIELNQENVQVIQITK